MLKIKITKENMMTLNISDVPIRFDFADSCNCSNCCRPRMREDVPIYVNHNLEIERFDFAKSANIDEDRAKSLERVRNALGSLLEGVERAISLGSIQSLRVRDIVTINAIIANSTPSSR